MLKHNGKPIVLVFFDGVDRKARSGMLGSLLSDAHFFLRNTKRKLCKQQAHSGFYVAFKSLVTCLKKAGCEVRINDFAFAEKHPDYPICMAGYPSILEHVNLPNPILFGPGSYGFPDEVKSIVQSDQYVRFMQPSEWAARLWKPYCGDKIWVWYAGIDTRQIPDFSKEEKIYDCLIYEKFLWDRENKAPVFLDRITNYLKQKGKSYKVIHYGQYTKSEYMQALKDTKSMIFLCEHETQGIAYQEALATNVPILAWDEGEFLDPNFKKFANDDLQASSVPYFDQRCGAKFKNNDFEESFDVFCNNLENYRPRDYVEDCLSMDKAAQIYLNEYSQFIRHKN